MIEKNFDPDSDHCPEKEMVENLYKLKIKENNYKVSEHDNDFFEHSTESYPSINQKTENN